MNVFRVGANRSAQPFLPFLLGFGRGAASLNIVSYLNWEHSELIDCLVAPVWTRIIWAKIFPQNIIYPHNLHYTTAHNGKYTTTLANVYIHAFTLYLNQYHTAIRNDCCDLSLRLLRTPLQASQNWSDYICAKKCTNAEMRWSWTFSSTANILSIHTSGGPSLNLSPINSLLCYFITYTQ